MEEEVRLVWGKLNLRHLAGSSQMAREQLEMWIDLTKRFGQKRSNKAFFEIQTVYYLYRQQKEGYPKVLAPCGP